MMNLTGAKRSHPGAQDSQLQKNYKMDSEIAIEEILESLGNFQKFFKERFSLKKYPEFYVSYDCATAKIIKYKPFNQISICYKFKKGRVKRIGDIGIVAFDTLPLHSKKMIQITEKLIGSLLKIKLESCRLSVQAIRNLMKSRPLNTLLLMPHFTIIGDDPLLRGERVLLKGYDDHVRVASFICKGQEGTMSFSLGTKVQTIRVESLGNCVALRENESLMDSDFLTIFQSKLCLSKGRCQSLDRETIVRAQSG